MPGSKLSHLWICSCVICDQPLPSREGRHTFKYFLMAGPGRPRIVWRARDTVPQLPEWRAKSALEGGGKRMLRCRLIAIVAPACAWAGSFARPSAPASKRCGAFGVVCFGDSKTGGAAGRCQRQTVKENLSAHFGGPTYFRRAPPLCARPPPAWPAYPRGQLRVLMPCIENRLHQQHLTC
jgi:hypothetical protein